MENDIQALRIKVMKDKKVTDKDTKVKDKDTKVKDKDTKVKDKDKKVMDKDKKVMDKDKKGTDKDKKVKDKDKKVKDNKTKNIDNRIGGKDNKYRGSPPPQRKDDKKTDANTPSERKPRKKSKRSKNPTFFQIGQTAGDNCCDCCRAMIDYIQEVCKLIWRLTGGEVEETRIAEVLCEMIEISLDIGRDCIDLVKYICRWLLPGK